MEGVCNLMEELDVSLEIDDVLDQDRTSLDLTLVARIVSCKFVNPKALLPVQHKSWTNN